MLVSRDAMRAFGWILVLTFSMVGCQSTPEQIASKTHSDDFGEVVPDKEEITIEAVQKSEMMHQRAQFELRLGGSFPFDLFDPGRDPHIDSFGENGPFDGSGAIQGVIGSKLQLEAAKNIYLGLSFDFTDHTVETGGGEQIFAVSGFDRLSVLGTIDYDIPLNTTGALDGLMLRVGMGMGMTVVDFNTLPQYLPPLGTQGKVEDIYQIMFRPSIGLRLPVSDNLLFFSEFTYDIVPEKSMAFETNIAIAGERAIFSSGAIIVGLSLQW